MNDENEVWVIPTDAPDTAPRIVEPRSDGVEYEIEQQGDQFLILTNAGNAVDFKIMTAPIDQPGRANWTDVIPHEAGRMIVGISAYQDWMIWKERANALPRICYLKRGRPIADLQVIAFDEEAYALGMDPSPEYDTCLLYTSDAADE